MAFMSFCTSVTWEALSSTMAQALTSGGSSSLVWGFVASALGALLIVLCVAEYASMIPTAGGQYHYVAELSPPRLRRILSFYAGWMTMLGWVLCALAGTFSSAMQIQAWAILFSPDYVYERWHTALIVIGLTSLFTIFAIFEVKYLHQLQFVAMFCHVVGYFATSIYLLTHVPEKNTAAYVFTDFTNLSGWDSPGISWLIGLLTSAIGFVSWDSPIHMAEEMTNVSRDLPRALLINVTVSAIATFPWVVAVAFCITDIAGVLAGPVGTISFMAQLFYNISGGNQAATIGLTMFLPVMSFCAVGSSVMTATSRIIWSFARDGGLPRAIAHVSDRTKTPIWALVLTWVLVSAFSLIYVGNATAFYGLSSACTVALLISYASPILLNVIWGFSHCHLPKGAFTLGRYHRYVAVAALAWSLCMIIMMCFPTYQPVTDLNMNYASVVVCGGMVVATIAWFTYGRTNYVAITEELDGSASNHRH
ncbi:amino acid transporter [Thozetella sp. PMI_491]|nr:amino acid transporter [Thozetella sp. PMI_491]